MLSVGEKAIVFLKFILPAAAAPVPTVENDTPLFVDLYTVDEFV
jgi:hypothetical protein